MKRRGRVILIVAGSAVLGLSYLLYPFFTSSIIPIQDFQFHPSILRIETGARVLWINYDVEPHDVVSGIPGMRDQRYLSNLLNPGGTFAFTFTEAGEYQYYCSIHPYMTGKIIVEDP